MFTILKKFGRFTLNIYSLTRFGGIGGPVLTVGNYELCLSIRLPFLVAQVFYAR
jgi:hypothetical protein